MVSEFDYLIIARILLVVLLHFTWQACLVFLVVAITRRLLGGEAKSRYAISLGGLFLLAILPLATASIYCFNPQFVAIEETLDESTMNRFVQSEALTGDLSAQSSLFPTSFSQCRVLLEEGTTGIFRWFDSNRRVWLSLWLIGLALFHLRLIISFENCCRLRKRSQALPPKIEHIASSLKERLRLSQATAVRVSEDISQAIATGIIKPMVLIPAAWLTQLPPASLEAVIAHELAHVRRFDLWINLLQRMVETVFFFHPCVWMLSKSIHRDREFCCDTLAVQCTGNRVEYARTLAWVAKCRQRPESDLVFSHAFQGDKKMNLLRRVRLVLEPTSIEKKSNRSLTAFTAFATAIVLGSIGVSVSVGAVAAVQDDEHTERRVIIVENTRDLPEFVQDETIIFKDNNKDDVIEILELRQKVKDKDGDTHWFAITKDGKVEFHQKSDENFSDGKDQKWRHSKLAMLVEDDDEQAESTSDKNLNLFWKVAPNENHDEEVELILEEDSQMNPQEIAKSLRKLADRLEKKDESSAKTIRKAIEFMHRNNYEAKPQRYSLDRLDTSINSWIVDLHGEYLFGKPHEHKSEHSKQGNVELEIEVHPDHATSDELGLFRKKKPNQQTWEVDPKSVEGVIEVRPSEDNKFRYFFVKPSESEEVEVEEKKGATWVPKKDAESNRFTWVPQKMQPGKNTKQAFSYHWSADPPRQDKARKKEQPHAANLWVERRASKQQPGEKDSGLREEISELRKQLDALRSELQDLKESDAPRKSSKQGIYFFSPDKPAENKFRYEYRHPGEWRAKPRKPKSGGAASAETKVDSKALELGVESALADTRFDIELKYVPKAKQELKIIGDIDLRFTEDTEVDVEFDLNDPGSDNPNSSDEEIEVDREVEIDREVKVDREFQIDQESKLDVEFEVHDEEVKEEKTPKNNKLLSEFAYKSTSSPKK